MLISKEKLLKDLKEWKGKLGNSPAEEAAEVMIKAFIDKINQMPEVVDADMNANWIPVDDEEHRPKNEEYVLVSFGNFALPDIARYEENEEGGLYFPGDMEYSYANIGLYVNAWQPLPDPYKEE